MLLPKFIDDCRLLYEKVYQAALSNGELTAKFAKGFVYERCHAALADPAGHRIAWARFGGNVLQNCEMQKGGIARKLNKFRAAYGPCGEASHLDSAFSSGPNISGVKLKLEEAVDLPTYKQLMDRSNALSVKADQQQQEKVLHVKAELQQKKDLPAKRKSVPNFQ